MRRVVVMAEAVEDLEAARDFYAESEAWVGDYCVDSLISDLQRLTLFHGIHRRYFGCYRMLASRFPFVTSSFPVVDKGSFPHSARRR